jgi:steroid delta-isomerase-like uncharacterized protein
MSTKLLELDRRYFDAWNSRDADAIAAAFAENSTYTHPALPEPLVGGPAVAEWAKTVWTILPDFKLDLVSRDATWEDGIVVNEWVYSGTDIGPHPDGAPPTERPAKCPGVTISQYEGDKIRWQRVYTDGWMNSYSMATAESLPRVQSKEIS